MVHVKVVPGLVVGVCKMLVLSFVLTFGQLLWWVFWMLVVLFVTFDDSHR